MTQWKIGDRAAIIEVSSEMKEGTQKGDIATVILLDEDGDPVFDIDEYTDCGWAIAEELFLPLITPKQLNTYETIQINGKLYNLVPVEA